MEGILNRVRLDRGKLCFRNYALGLDEPLI